MAQFKRFDNQARSGIFQCVAVFMNPSILITSRYCLDKLVGKTADSTQDLVLSYGHRYLAYGWTVKKDFMDISMSWTFTRTDLDSGPIVALYAYNEAKRMIILHRFEGRKNINNICMDDKNATYSVDPPANYQVVYYDDWGNMAFQDVGLINCPIIVRMPALCAKAYVEKDLNNGTVDLPALKVPLGSPLVHLVKDNWYLSGIMDMPVDVNNESMDWSDFYPNMFYFVRPQVKYERP